MKKKLFTIALSAIMVIAMAVPVFAGIGGTVSESDLTEKDTPHGHYFNYGNYILNQWGNAPVSGTRVTTWSKTNDITQAWDVRYTNSGGWIVTTNYRPDLALNIYRSGSNPEVNLVPYIGNTFNDCVLTKYTLTLKHQIGAYSNYGVTIQLGENTNPYNTYGKICRWTSSPTNWTHTL